MRRLAALALALLLAPAIARAQSVSVGQAAVTSSGVAIWADSTEVLTFAGNPTGTVCAAAMAASSTTNFISSVTGLGGTWELEVQQSGPPGGVSMWCNRTVNGASAAVTINMSAADASANVGAVIVNFTNGGNSWSAAAAHVNGSSGTGVTGAHDSGTATPAAANNVCLSFLKGANTTWTTTGETDWTDVLHDTRRIFAYAIQTAATAQQYSPTTAGAADHAMAIACIDSTGGGAATPPRMPWPNWIGGGQ